jgi:NAD(P)-dependent dehydrogenase (short-subunit alcohol dehydrogenase family)
MVGQRVLQILVAGLIMGSRQRVAVISGAARGIGQALCRHFARAGVAIVGVDLGDCSETGGLVEAENGSWFAIRADVSDPAAVTQAAHEVAERFGRADILVNCAGIWPHKPFDQLEFDEWRRIMSINLDSQFLMSKAFVPAMKEAGWGRIVNFTSGSVLFPVPNYAAYKASKMGSIGLTRAMASDLGQFGITVNAVSPGLTPTPGLSEHGGDDLIGVLGQVVQMQAIKRPSHAEDVVGLVLFLASDAAAFVTGQTMLADGGLSYL